MSVILNNYCFIYLNGVQSSLQNPDRGTFCASLDDQGLNSYDSVHLTN